MADPEFCLLGDALWLDFINTAASPPGARDMLPDSAAWTRWARTVQIPLPAGGSDYPDALVFRRRLRQLAESLAMGRLSPPSSIEWINRLLRDQDGHRALVRVKGAWQLRFTPRRAPTALEAVAASAASTLSNPVARVRQCPGPDCGLYFVDQSPNHTRHHCSPERCGNVRPGERRRGSRPAPLLNEG